MEASIALANGDAIPDGVMERVDEILDDGDLSSGLFRVGSSDYYIYILQM